MPKPIVALHVALAAIMVSFVVPLIFPVVLKGNSGPEITYKQNKDIISSLPVTAGVSTNAFSVFVNIPTPSSDDPNCPVNFLSNNLTVSSDQAGNFSTRKFTLESMVKDNLGNMMTCNQVISDMDNKTLALARLQNIAQYGSITETSHCNSLQSFLAAGRKFHGITTPEIHATLLNAPDECQLANIHWTHAIDEDNYNSIEFTETGYSLSRTVGWGTPQVVREAIDDCDNISSCKKIIQVRDCKAPTGIVHRWLAANLTAPSGKAYLHARMYNNGSIGNCTPVSILGFSFSPITTDTLRNNDCSVSGQLPVQVRVSDPDGNQTIVNGNVVVQDKNNINNNLHRISVAGTVRTVDSQPIPETKIMVEGGETYLDQMTNEEGKFCFQSLGLFNDYSVFGERMEEQMRGVSTLDLVLIQRHIMEIEKFNDPFSLLAGDVDGSGNINSLDLVSLRKLILGTLDTFPGNKPWKFVRENQAYSDPENPWMENLAFQFENMDSSRPNTNFTGIKTGDVNHSYSQDIKSFVAEKKVINQAELHVEDILLQKDKVTSVALTAKNLENIIAQQFTLEITGDGDYIGFEAVNLPLTVEQIALVKKNGKSYITCAFHSTEAVDIQDGSVLCNLLFQAKSDIRTSRIFTLNDDITPGMVYTNDKGKKPIALFFNSQRKPETALAKQNIPNPFKEETTLEYILTNRATVQFSIYDGAGQMVYKAQMEGNPGLNSIPIGQKELGNARGVLFVKIKSEELNEVVRMLRIE